MRRTLLPFAFLLTAPLPAQTRTVAAQRSPTAVPTPASVLGFEPGTDRKLPSWSDVGRYFAALDAASPRITVRTLGRTTLGRPFLAAFIADSSTLANLPRYQEIQRRLADARTWRSDDRARLIAEG